MKLVLRGHHLLCLKGFQGYGYSPDFVDNMSRINTLRKSSDTVIQLTNTPDDICKACPNLNDGICENIEQNKRIVFMDNEMLKNFDTTKEYDAQKLFEKVDLIFNNQRSVEKICFNCRWHDECLFYRNL